MRRSRNYVPLAAVLSNLRRSPALACGARRSGSRPAAQAGPAGGL